MKEFKVTVYDYDLDLGCTVITDCESFDAKEDALKYASSVEHTISSRAVVYADYGYTVIATGSRRLPITIK